MKSSFSKFDDLVSFVAMTLVSALACPPALASGPGITNDFGGKRVLIIGIDGCRSDALQAADAPNIRALMAAGVTTWTGTAGGELNGVTQQSTVSGPGWTTILTGRYANVHGVTGNATAPYDTPGGYQVSQAPHFAKRLKELVPTSSFSSVVSWNWIEDYIVAAQPSDFSYHAKAAEASYPDRDLEVKNKAVAQLAGADPDVLFVHFDQVDGAGHSSGFNVTNPAYMGAIRIVDDHVGSIVNAMKSRPQYAKENWLIVVTTDHGGTPEGVHGGQSVGERTIPVIVSGNGVDHGRTDATTLGHHIIPAIAFKHLGLPADPEWQAGIFGFPPYLDTEAAENAVHLRWEMPADGLAGLTAIEIRRGGTLVGTLPATAREYKDSPAPPAGSSSVYEVTFLGTGEIRTATVTPPASPDVSSNQ
ncbi:MAG: alkaline phosphatase family protein [Verrucomicrobiota bacterium]